MFFEGLAMATTLYRRALQRTINQIRITAYRYSNRTIVPAQAGCCHYQSFHDYVGSRSISVKTVHLHPRREFQTSTVFRETVQYKLSDIGEGIREVVVLEWFVKPGDKVEEFDSICEVKSDKAAVTITSRYAGIVKKLYHEVDAVALVGQPLVDIEIEGSALSSKQEEDVRETDSQGSASSGISGGPKILATPAVRRLAMENNLKLSDVPGSGREGRVLKEDVLKFLEAKQAPSSGMLVPDPYVAPPPPSPTHVPPTPTTAPGPKTASPHIMHPTPQAPIGQDRTVPLKGVAKAMVKIMTEALKIPPFSLYDEVDVSALVDLRNRLKTLAAERGIQLTYMPIFIKAASLALHQFPVLNSSLDQSGENIIYKAAHNIGVAMDTPEGLVVPAIKNVQNLTIFEIAIELNRLQTLGLAGKLGTEELSGITFSLSNIGTIGGTYATPVIMPPNVAIGAIGKIQELPRFDQDQLVKKVHIMNISWTADHRVIDGATMAKFSNLWKQYLEDPSKFMLNMK